MHRTAPLICALIAAGLAGCQSTAHLDRGPTRDWLGQPRSLALPSPAMRVLQQADGSADPNAPLPWYADRSDRGPVVQSGYRSPVLETVTTHTRDELETRGQRGLVEDFDRTTHRTTIRQIVR